MSGERPSTTDEELLSRPAPGLPASREGDELRVSRMRAELSDGFAALAGVELGVTVFGSARTRPDDADYRLARAVAERLGRHGFAIITGAGPGIMEAANCGARDAGALSVGLAIQLAFEEGVNDFLDIYLKFNYFFTRKVMFVRYATAYVIFPGEFGMLDGALRAGDKIQTAKVHAPPVVLVRRSIGSRWWRGCTTPLRRRARSRPGTSTCSRSPTTRRRCSARDQRRVGGIEGEMTKEAGMALRTAIAAVTSVILLTACGGSNNNGATVPVSPTSGPTTTTTTTTGATTPLTLTGTVRRRATRMPARRRAAPRTSS